MAANLWTDGVTGRQVSMMSLLPRDCRFFLGTHETSWLRRTGVPLFISHRRLAMRAKMPQAIGPWALDSGGFTELNLHGRWTVPARDYAAAVSRYQNEIGGLLWAAPQDWMCEVKVLAKTGRSIADHQALTTQSFLDLSGLAPLPWAPVLQGFEPDDYERHADDYERAGVDLSAAPIVGVGSVCRRQDTRAAADIFRRLFARGLKLHGFGLKLGGLVRSARYLKSADSLAWSYGARRAPPPAGMRTPLLCQLHPLRARMARSRSPNPRCRMKPIPITSRAELRGGARIHVLNAPKVGRIRHVLPFPVAVCPVSRNPLSGTITIEYVARAFVLEVVSLHQVIDEVVTTSSSVEGAATDIAIELLKALGFQPDIMVEVQVMPGPQTLTVWPVVAG